MPPATARQARAPAETNSNDRRLPAGTASAMLQGMGLPSIFGAMVAPVTAISAARWNSNSGPSSVHSSTAASSALPTSRLAAASVLVQRARRRNAQVVVALAALVLHRGGQSGLEDFDVGSVSHVASPAGGRCTIAAPAGIPRARGNRTDAQREAAVLDLGLGPVVFLAIDGLELDDVAGPEEHHRIAQMRQALARLEDRRGRHAEHLITAGAAHGINAAEATAMSHRVPGRVGAWPQVLRHLQLTLALDHLEHEGQAGHETHHGHEPGRAGMRVDEGLHRRKAVDACGVFQIGGCRVLVPLAKAHQRLVRPRVVVVDRDFDDARVQAEVGHVDAVLQLAQQGQQRVGRDAIGS